MQRSSFWEKDSFLQPYDLIIVGSGIVGLSTALFYKQQHPNQRVGILERGFLPSGASTRNAGFACVGSIGEHSADMGKASEEEIGQRIKRRYDGLELLKDTLGEDKIGYEHCGGYEFFKSEQRFEEVASEIDHFNGWMENLVGEEQVYTTDSIEGYPVIHNRLEGALNPGKLMQELVQKVNTSGIDIKWNSRVLEVSKSGLIDIQDGPKLKARKVLLAANGFVQELLPQIPVKPARGFVLVTSELEELPWRGIFHHDCGYIYFRNVGDRLLIGGARNLDIEGEQTDQFGKNDIIKEQLVQFTDNVLRLPDDWEVEDEWSGIMGFSSTKSPIVRQVDKHRYIAAGLSGMGIAIGMDVGQAAVEMLAGDIK